VVTDVSEQLAVFNLRGAGLSEIFGTTLATMRCHNSENYGLSYRQFENVEELYLLGYKGVYLTALRGFIFRKVQLLITTSVRTSNRRKLFAGLAFNNK
jgi:hypothetical protein